MSAFDPLQTLDMHGTIRLMNRHISKSSSAFFGAFTILSCSFAVTPAHACGYVTWPFQLPGETEQGARERSAQILSDQRTNARIAREDFDLKNSLTIYIARVLSNNRAQGIRIRPKSIVEPVEAISGRLPSIARTLIEVESNSCSNWGDGYGDGEGTAASVGSLVVIFEGLPKSANRPNGIDSLRATSVRRAELLERLSKYGKEFDEGREPAVR